MFLAQPQKEEPRRRGQREQVQSLVLTLDTPLNFLASITSPVKWESQCLCFKDVTVLRQVLKGSSKIQFCHNHPQLSTCLCFSTTRVGAHCFVSGWLYYWGLLIFACKSWFPPAPMPGQISEELYHFEFVAMLLEWMVLRICVRKDSSVAFISSGKCIFIQI